MAKKALKLFLRDESRLENGKTKTGKIVTQQKPYVLMLNYQGSLKTKPATMAATHPSKRPALLITRTRRPKKAGSLNKSKTVLMISHFSKLKDKNEINYKFKRLQGKLKMSSTGIRDIECIRMKELSEAIKLHKSTIHRMICEGSFPRGIRVGKNSVVYRIKDVKEWQERMANKSN